MTTWIKPAVGWGNLITDPFTGERHLEYEFSRHKVWPRGTYYDHEIRVALVPLAVARKAGLLRRPK